MREAMLGKRDKLRVKGGANAVGKGEYRMYSTSHSRIYRCEKRWCGKDKRNTVRAKLKRTDCSARKAVWRNLQW
jgi:hypothetical protein